MKMRKNNLKNELDYYADKDTKLLYLSIFVLLDKCWGNIYNAFNKK